MKFLADEGIDRSIVAGLRKLGFDVFYVVEQTRSINDDIVLQIALDEDRILVTRDKDFGELVLPIAQSTLRSYIDKVGRIYYTGKG